MSIPSCCNDNDNIDDDNNWVSVVSSVDSSISVKLKPRAIFKNYILLLARSLGKKMAKYNNGSKFWTSKLTFMKQTKKGKKTYLSITYIDFPRKCDPLIYTYQSAQFIFLMKYLYIFVCVCFFFFFFFFSSFSIFSTFFGLNMDKFKKKSKTKTKEKIKQTNFRIFINFSKFVFVLFFFFDI